MKSRLLIVQIDLNLEKDDSNREERKRERESLVVQEKDPKKPKSTLWFKILLLSSKML